MTRPTTAAAQLRFRGGTAGALLPFALFLAGVAWLALSGAPDERGFWPILLAALALGLALARDKRTYCETLIDGMSQPIVMLMIMAWLLAGVFAALMRASGLVDGLVWLAQATGVSGPLFVVAAFLVCGGVSLAFVEMRVRSPRGAELWIFSTVSAAVLLTTHSVVAILAVGPFTRRLGERLRIGPYRRSNLLDVTVCTYPFLLPYCIPTILAASLIAGSGPSPISPAVAGLHNFHSWALLLVIVTAIVTGYGRADSPPGSSNTVRDIVE